MVEVTEVLIVTVVVIMVHVITIMALDGTKWGKF